jgi:hypothetical protein
MFIGIPVDCLDSDSIDTLSANPITGDVYVRFQRYRTRRPYAFKASRRAILSLLVNSKGSKGKWVNLHCTPAA